jgi:hypothetical protein
MANSITVAGLINSAKVEKFVSPKTAELFHVLNINITESRYKGKDDSDNAVYEKQYYTASIWLRDEPNESVLSRFGEGFHITLTGELEMDTFVRKDGSVGINAKIKTTMQGILIVCPRKDQLLSNSKPY